MSAAEAAGQSVEKAHTPITALIAKYDERAANPSARYVRAEDVAADLRAALAGGQTCPCGCGAPMVNGQPFADHPHTDPRDGRTECQTCGSKGVPATVAAQQRASANCWCDGFRHSHHPRPTASPGGRAPYSWECPLEPVSRPGQPS